MPICPYCRDDLPELAGLACQTCQTPVHAECAATHGGCVTFGCEGSTFHRPRPRPSQLDPGWPLALRLRQLVALPADDVAVAVLGVLGVASLLVLALA